MGYNSDSADWPTSPVPTAVKLLIDKFYNALDNPGPEAGSILADEIFADDGKAQFGPQSFEGREQIRKSRDGAWTAFSSRKHILLKVYSCNENADDLLCISHAGMELKNGQAVSQDFTCRFQIADPQGESPKIQSYNIWADFAPVLNALQGR